MTFRFAHNNFNVRDLDKSLAFYKEALGLTEIRRSTAARRKLYSGPSGRRRRKHPFSGVDLAERLESTLLETLRTL